MKTRLGFVKQMVEEGRDSWEIEITGGPLIERNTDPNYNYTDLVDSYWPASLAAIQYYTNRITTQYVGQSNGCRVALSSLEKYQNTGKSNVAKVQNLATGNYVTVNLQGSQANPIVDTFVGTGCPGAFHGDSRFIQRAILYGDSALQQLASQTHVGGSDYARLVDRAVNIFFIGSDILATGPPTKISLNLLKFYNSIATSTFDGFDLSNLTINKTFLVVGNYTGLLSVGQDNDLIVPINDSLNILNKIQSNVKGGLITSYLHNSLPDKQIVKRYITEVLDQ